MTGQSNKKKRLGDLLIQESLLTQKQLDRAVQLQREKGGRLSDILVDLNYCTEEKILSVLAKRAGVPFVSSLSSYGPVSPEVLALIAPALARERGVVPLAKEGSLLTVALADPFVDLHAVDDLKMQTGLGIKIVLASPAEIQKAVALFYPFDPHPVPSVEPSVGRGDGLSDSQMATVVDALIANAVKMGARFVFIEPGAERLQVRYRLHGGLQARPDLPLAHHDAMLAHIKSLSRMDALERWLPQSGRWRGVWAGKSLDIQVSTLPTVNGEKVVLALEDSARSSPLDLAKIGLSSEILGLYQKMIEARTGLFLVAGPVGAGKTATLYATLAGLNARERHILTIEDPVERLLDGISQMQVRADLRITLASGLHLLRRQSPDVLMVSEISDVNTAIAAMDTSGECLVISSVIAPDALGAIHKLVEMGVSPPLLAERLVGVLGQCVVRKICSNCREPYTLSLRELMSAGLGEKEIRGAKREASFTVYRGRGCGRCLATGYDGISSIFEVLTVTPNVRRLISERASPVLLVRETSERVTLREAAMKKVLQGETSVDEALRIG